MKEKRSDEALSLIEQHLLFAFDKSAAEKTSDIGTKLRQLGKQIEIRDLFNASICISRRIPILTRNTNHYQRVPELIMIDV